MNKSISTVNQETPNHQKDKNMKKLNSGLVVACGFLAMTLAIVPAEATPVPVPLQQATATFSQGTFVIGNTIDGGALTHWGIYPATISPIVAVWETQTDESHPQWEFSFHHNAFNPGTLPRKTRISYTTDDRSTFADGLASGGDVTANWTELAPTSIDTSLTGGQATTINGDNTIDWGTPTGNGINIVTVNTALANVTGFRLELIAVDPDGFGYNGPGDVDNTLLSEIKIEGANLLLPVSFTNIVVENVAALEFQSDPSTVYRLEYITDPVDTNWTDAGFWVFGDGGLRNAYDPAGFSTQKTYRILSGP
jgi:hypothetical protein